jgi:hypothetical protein
MDEAPKAPKNPNVFVQTNNKPVIFRSNESMPENACSARCRAIRVLVALVAEAHVRPGHGWSERHLPGG